MRGDCFLWGSVGHGLIKSLFLGAQGSHLPLHSVTTSGGFEGNLSDARINPGPIMRKVISLPSVWSLSPW